MKILIQKSIEYKSEDNHKAYNAVNHYTNAKWIKDTQILYQIYAIMLTTILQKLRIQALDKSTLFYQSINR